MKDVHPCNKSLLHWVERISSEPLPCTREPKWYHPAWLGRKQGMFVFGPIFTYAIWFFHPIMYGSSSVLSSLFMRDEIISLLVHALECMYSTIIIMVMLCFFYDWPYVRLINAFSYSMRYVCILAYSILYVCVHHHQHLL